MDKSIYIEIRDRLKTLISGTEFENRVFFVGGCCRDDIMGCEIKDIDISVALPDGGIRLAQWLHAEGHTVSEPSVFHDYHTAKFRLAEYPEIELESVQTRKESYPDRESRNPVTSYGTHEEDCMRRDLTVNALYQNVSTGEIVDITGKGLDDIHDHIIRTPADPYRTYDEDPLRILRCVRFAARFGWEIEKETLAAMVEMVPRMSILTPARISEEFLKMLQDDRPAMAVELLCDIKAIGYILPCIPKADSVEAQALVAKLQAHITANFYACTDEILAGLGKMYACDERFKKNIDKSGEGTAEYASEAIAKALTKADSENLLSCSYLGRNIDEGLCYDIQMISNSYILPSALPDIKIDKSMALKACETCEHKMCEVET